MSIIIKRVTAKEWQVYREIRLEALQKSPEAFGSNYDDNLLIPDDEWQKRVLRFSTDNTACSLIAYSDEKPIGMVTYINDKEPSMFQMWVNPSFRKQSIGENLVLHLQYWVQKSGQDHMVCSVFKNNVSALNLYLKLGFVKTHEDEQEIYLKWIF